MKRIETFMNVEVELDPVTDRARYQKQAEAGDITPKAYWQLLKASWNNMTPADKAEEMEVQQDEQTL